MTTEAIHDAVAADPILRELNQKYPTIELVHANLGYRGDRVAMVERELSFEINLSSKPEGVKGFHPLRQRWVVWNGRSHGSTAIADSTEMSKERPTPART